MEVAKRAVTIACPDCEHEIHLSSIPEMGQKVTCPDCWAYLEVVSLEPLELAWEVDLIQDDGYADWVEEKDW